MNSLKKQRLKAKMTQKQVAEKINVDRSTVTKWEDSERMPPSKKLSELAKLLNCTVDELLK